MAIDTPKLEDVVRWISRLVRRTVQEKDGRYQLEIAGQQLQMSGERIEQALTTLATRQLAGETLLYDARTYEVLVREEIRFRPSFIPRDKSVIKKEDLDNNIVYEIGVPSDEYLIIVLMSLSQSGALGDYRTLIPPFALRRMVEKGGDIDFFDLVKLYIPRLLTVRVKTGRSATRLELAKFSNAFLFHLTFNLDTALVEVRSWDDIQRVVRLARRRRAKVDDIDPPRRTYVPDLTYHYQMAVAADNHVLGFLSLYHVLEHHFESVFQDDVIASVQKRLTQPDFSYRRKKDIGNLVAEITKRVRIRNETVTFSEQEALRLTLLRYVKIDDLVSRLESYDPSLIDYYSTSAVSFSGGDPVDLRGADGNLIWRHLSARIYKTRNAVVHSKESERAKFIPFEHDRALGKELPLLRFIAEDVIVATSTVLE